VYFSILSELEDFKFATWSENYSYCFQFEACTWCL